MNDIQALDSFPVYDKKPHLNESEKREVRKTIEQIFQGILDEAKGVDSDRVWEDENALAQKMHELSLSEVTQKQLEGHIKAIRKIRRQIQIISNSRPQTADAVKQVVRLRAKLQGYDEKSILDQVQFIEDNTEGQSYKELLEEKKITLKKGLAQRLEGEEGAELMDRITNLLIRLSEERFSQGRPAHTADGLSIMIYELVYGDYLWRGKTRKSGNESYFRAHLIAAAENQVSHGFTSVMSLLCAIKHDDAEDLAIHKRGCWIKRTDENGEKVKNKDLEYKGDWLFCDEIYRHKLTPKGVLSPTSDPHIKIDNGKLQVERTVLALTSPAEEQVDLDEEKAIKYLEELLKNGYAAALKVIEQIQNAQTIQYLRPDRQDEKLRLMMILHGLMAKALEMKFAEHSIIGSGIDHLNKDLRPWFNTLQKNRMRERLGLVGERVPGDSLLACLLTGRKNRIVLKESDENPLSDLLEACMEGSPIGRERQIIQRKVHATLRPMHAGIESIEIRPIPLEEYLDVKRFLASPKSYRPEITSDDPMFEVVVCLKSTSLNRERIDDSMVEEYKRKLASHIGAAQLNSMGESEKTEMAIQMAEREASQERAWNVTADILRTFKPDRKSEIDPEIPPMDRPQIGYELEVVRQELGGKFRFRVNLTEEEVLLKRGLRARQTGEQLPDWLRDRVKETLRVAKYRTESIFTIAEEILLRKVMKVETDEERSDRIYLNEGDTMLDFAASLPTDKAIRALIYGVAAYKRVNGARRQVSMFDPLSEDDICYVEVQENEDSNVNFDLAYLPFSNSKKPRDILQRWITKEYKSGNERKKARVQLATEYIKRLRRIFGEDKIPSGLLETINMLVHRQYPNGSMKKAKKSKKSHEINADSNLERFLESNMKVNLNQASGSYKKNLDSTLEHIGNGNFDPLRALAKYIDPSKPCRISIETKHKSGKLAEITDHLKRAGVNIRKVENIDAMQEVTKVHLTLENPAEMSPYDFAKLILRLSFEDDVQVLSPIYTFTKDPELVQVWNDLKSLGFVE